MDRRCSVAAGGGVDLLTPWERFTESDLRYSVELQEIELLGAAMIGATTSAESQLSRAELDRLLGLD